VKGYELSPDAHGVGPKLGSSKVQRLLVGAHAQELGSCPRAPENRGVQAGGVEIIVEIHQGEDGRPTGTVRAAGSADARRFSGNLEFIALVESLYGVDDCPTTPVQPTTKGQDDV
jgi:hypothetical protein